MSYAIRYNKQHGRRPSTGLCDSGQFLWRRFLRLSVAALLLAALVPATPRADPLLTYPLRIGEHTIRAEIANTPDTRRKGLMFRKRLAESSGMIFIFPREQRISMWMKNTPIPLSVAFIGADGHILNIEDMQPNTEESHSSAGPARFALETNQGWFSKHGIAPGDQVSGLEHLPAPH